MKRKNCFMGLFLSFCLHCKASLTKDEKIRKKDWGVTKSVTTI